MCEWGLNKIIEINGRWWRIDACIADEVQLLNSRGIRTIGSCCGHSKFPGRIILSLVDENTVLNARAMGLKPHESDYPSKGCWVIDVHARYDDDDNY